VKRAPFDEYLKDPIGRWTGSVGWCHFLAADPWLAGTIMWGPLEAKGLEQMLRCATAAKAVIPEPHAVIVDGRRVRSVDPVSFQLTADYTVRHRRELEQIVTQCAGVRPGGLFGAVAEGYWRIVPVRYPVMVFSERGEALQWLGCEAHAGVLDDIERKALSATEDTSLIEGLHRKISEQPVDMTPELAAKGLGMSLRSLQRKLQAEGTTFQRELTVVRIRIAQSMMLEADTPLARVAVDVGFASPAVFSVAFRKLVGASPKEWRDARRRADPVTRDNETED
jgi:AraC-like DNA-binding protein